MTRAACCASSGPQLLLHNRLLSRLCRVSMAMYLVSMAMAISTRARRAYTHRSRDEKLSLTAAGEERERKREKGVGGRLTVMTTWRAAGERPRPSTDVVFVARRPKVLNMSGVRQRLQDSLQLQIQKEFWPDGRPAVHSWNESLCWEASRRQEMTLNVMNSSLLLLLFFLARLRCFVIDLFRLSWCQQTCSAPCRWRVLTAARHSRAKGNERRQAIRSYQDHLRAPPRHGRLRVAVQIFPQPSQRSGGTFPAAVS